MLALKKELGGVDFRRVWYSHFWDKNTGAKKWVEQNIQPLWRQRTCRGKKEYGTAENVRRRYYLQNKPAQHGYSER